MADQDRDIPYLKSRSYTYRRRFTELASRALTFTARANLPYLTALIIKLLCIRVQRAKASKANARTILMLPKAGLTEDIMASLGGEENFEVIAFERTIPKGVFAAFLPHIEDDNAYINDPIVECDVEADEKTKVRCRQFWVAMLEHLRTMMTIDGFVTGNFSYFAERELGAAAEEMGIAFVILHKECRKTPRLADFYAEVYEARKGPFKGRNVLTYNEIEKDIQVRAGTMPGSEIFVTGMPRMDNIHARRRREANGSGAVSAANGSRPQVLFFSVFAHYALPFIRRVVKGEAFDEKLPEKWSTHNWGALMRDCHLAMVELARQNSDIDVIIKTKGDPVAADNIREMFGAELELPENLRVVAGGDPLDLIFASHVVCGFNTTALVEAIAADVPVVVPAFGEATDPAMAGFVMQFGEAVDYADNIDRLKSLVLGHLKSERRQPQMDLGEEEIKVMEHWVGNGDGNAGTRVRDKLFAITGG